LVPAPAEIALKEARDARARGDDGAAEKSLGQALALDPSFDAARIDLVQLLLDRGDTAAARGHWSLLSGR
ncbi:MAG TPA: hypothetical protein PLD37_11055, partial [Usitatibacteraceae bacterium]|nr:hypothetical protein [Usitatibacteraceae bacterium]